MSLHVYNCMPMYMFTDQISTCQRQGICNSCLLVFTVHEICTARGLYVLPKVEMRQLTCTDRLYKANHQISFRTRMSILYCTYSMPSVQLKVPYAVAILV